MVARFRADTAAVKGRYALTASTSWPWTLGAVLAIAAVSFISGFCYAIFFLLNLGEETIDRDEL